MLEREFGVPIPGRVVAPHLWTKTALKKLPETGPLPWADLFGRSSPLVVDIGCGNGRFILSSALSRPQYDHLGIDVLPLVLRYATRRANQRGLSNVRFAACDGWKLLDRYVAPATLHEVHCYHPQPYHERGHEHKRLLTPTFLAKVHSVLTPEGLFVVQTDNAPYWNYFRGVVGTFFDWHDQEGPWPEAPRGRTRREIIARRKKLPVFRGWGKPLSLSVEEATRRADNLSGPYFDAGPPDPELDRLERL